MSRRFVTIWFRHLTADWLALRRPGLRQVPFVFAAPARGRIVITAASAAAEEQGIRAGMPVADAKVTVPGLQVFNDRPGRAARLLKALGEWCIRFTPVVALDPPDGLILDSGGCAHLWGGEHAYLEAIVTRLRASGYDVRAAMADTVGAAWAVSRFGQAGRIVESGEQASALLPLPPAALRLEPGVLARLQKLGLRQIDSFIRMPRPVLRRRFGEDLLLRLHQALGGEEEFIQPLRIAEPYQVRLPCLEPIQTAGGIEIAIQRLLEGLCRRLGKEGKGLRTAVLKCYRVDGRILEVKSGTSRASNHAGHLFGLFKLKIPSIEPGLGIELFMLEAPDTEDVPAAQEAFWTGSPGLDDRELAELIDRLTGRIGAGTVCRYLPDEHFWPERSVKPALSLEERTVTAWRTGRPRPVRLLTRPEPVEVAAPVPDYPPIMFRYKGQTHYIRKADGPERIEREWWLEGGDHRDYYQVEDEGGQRYWLFRSGHYSAPPSRQWFLHGFFA